MAEDQLLYTAMRRSSSVMPPSARGGAEDEDVRTARRAASSPTHPTVTPHLPQVVTQGMSCCRILVEP
eukprot:scaffold25567_cov121-Isochrysis_galbana.AAC.3